MALLGNCFVNIGGIVCELFFGRFECKDSGLKLKILLYFFFVFCCLPGLICGLKNQPYTIEYLVKDSVSRVVGFCLEQRLTAKPR